MNNNQLHNEHPDFMANIDGDANLIAGESEYDVEDILNVGSPDPPSGSESKAPNWDSEDHTEEDGEGGDAGSAGDEAVEIENEEYEKSGEEGNDGDVEDEGDDEDDDDADTSKGERPPFIRSVAPSPELPPWASA